MQARPADAGLLTLPMENGRGLEREHTVPALLFVLLWRSSPSSWRAPEPSVSVFCSAPVMSALGAAIITDKRS